VTPQIESSAAPQIDPCEIQEKSCALSEKVSEIVTEKPQKTPEIVTEKPQSDPPKKGRLATRFNKKTQKVPTIPPVKDWADEDETTVNGVGLTHPDWIPKDEQ
jgi:hypothetical protein